MTRSDADFADPSFEPTDEQLLALSREAFAGVGDRNREALARLRAEVSVLRAEVRASLVQRADPSSPSR